MNRVRGISLLAIGLVAGAASAADLSKIDRQIAKEPAYTSGKVRYCLTVFGAEAAERIWLVLDGRSLYVDVNGNGDLTEKDEKFRLASVGADREVSLDKGRLLDFTAMGDAFWLTYTGEGVHTQYAQPIAIGKAAEAPIVHFAGPLTLRVNTKELEVSSDDPELYISVGTPGLGERTFASISHSKLPEDAHPVAEIELPAKDSNAKPSTVRPSPAKPTTVRLDLKERC